MKGNKMKKVIMTLSLTGLLVSSAFSYYTYGYSYSNGGNTSYNGYGSNGYTYSGNSYSYGNSGSYNFYDNSGNSVTGSWYSY